MRYSKTRSDKWSYTGAFTTELPTSTGIEADYEFVDFKLDENLAFVSR